jgi:alanine racemase
MPDLVKACISRAALRHNLQLLQALSRGTPVCAVVKANAYGHGLPLVVRAYRGLKLMFWGAASLPEALALRRAGAREPALIFRPLDFYDSARNLRELVDAMLEINARATVVNRAGLELAAAGARRRGITARIHIKADTGMGRNGCPAAEAVALARLARTTPGVLVEGFYSHFADADARDLASARRQLRLFRSLVGALAAGGLQPPLCHIANSGAVFNLPGARLDLIRPGIALYGYGGKFMRGSRRLRPVLRLETPVIFTKWINQGQACGYGATFVARRRTRLGLLPVGYADGYSRRWSNAGWVDFDGRLAPVIGRVSMDLTIVDLTDLPGVAVGQPACLISPRRSDPHSVEAMAERLETIPHEITTALGNRVRRVLVP